MEEKSPLTLFTAAAALSATLIFPANAVVDQGDAPAPYPNASHSEGSALKLGADRGSDNGIVFTPPLKSGNTDASVTVTVNGADPLARLDA